MWDDANDLVRWQDDGLQCLPFPLDITFQVELFAVIDSVCELRYPVAEDNNARLAVEGKVKLYVPMPEDEEIHIGMLPQVLLGKDDERLLVLDRKSVV